MPESSPCRPRAQRARRRGKAGATGGSGPDELRDPGAPVLRRAAPRAVPVHARASRRRCTGAATGRCASTRASAAPGSPIAVTGTCFRRGRPGSRWPSTCRRRWGTTRTTRSPGARSARSGVAIATLDDMRVLTDGLPLSEVSISMTINSTAAILLAHAARRRARARGRLDDPLGHGPERPPQGIRRARDLHLPAARLAEDHDRHLRVLRARGAALEHHLDLRVPHPRGGLDRGAGSGLHARQRRSPTSRRRSRAVSRSTTSRRASPSSSTRTRTSSRRSRNSAPRAALWAEIVRERFGAKDPRSWRMRFHAQTAGSTLTAQQTDVNIVRVALAGALGGARRSAVAPHERLRRGARAADGGARRGSPCARSRSSRRKPASPTSSTRSAARRSWRSGPTRSDRARALIAKIDALGGAVAAIENGFFGARDRGGRLRGAAGDRRKARGSSSA